MTREADLAEVRSSTVAHGCVQVTERVDPQASAEVEQPMQHLRACLGVGERPVGRFGAAPEILRERLEADVRHVRPDHATSQPRRADRRRGERFVIEAPERCVHEPEVEARVVGDEDAPGEELDETGDDPLDRRRIGDGEVVDPGEVGDVAGDRTVGFDQRVEGTEALSAPVLHGTDLGDGAIAGRAAGRFEVHDTERHLVEGDAFLERGLVRLGLYGRLPYEGEPRGARA